ncbi:hypothetical protein P8452_75817 [Trifolium repens]|nr:hypothetical protein P8452_75817 [Trifolium repens]
MIDVAVSQGCRYSLTLRSLLLLHPLLFLSHSFSFRLRSFHQIQTSSSSGRFIILFRRRLFQIWISPVYDYVGGGGVFTKTSQVIENEIVTIISSVLYFEKK